MTTATNSKVDDLRSKLEQHGHLAELLTESLQKAKTIGKAELDRDLFEALRWWPDDIGQREDSEDVGWPEDITTYLRFLENFVKWKPRQSSDKAWTAPGTDEHQEVYDRLCHFYWLIDQKVGSGTKIVEDDEWFSEWLISYADAFANGTFAHYFLGPYSYHRFHTPVAGILRECRAVKGLVYLEVNIAKQQFDAPDTAQGGYEFYQARGIVILDTTGSAFGDVGLVGVVPIGMCQVSSVNMTAVVGSNMLKGDEFGYFLFGGSDIIVLFQEGTNPQVYTGKDYHHYGTTIATCDKR